MASNHEVQVDGVVQPCQYSPHEVQQNKSIFSALLAALLCQHLEAVVTES